MSKSLITCLFAALMLLLVACGGQAEQAAPTVELAAPTTEVVAPAEESAAAAEVDLDAVKQYALDHGNQMKAGSAALAATAQTYYDLIAGHDFDYEAAWNADAATLTQLMTDAKAHWLTASTHYELDEGIIAGVPSLAFYDVWIDAGPSAEEAPNEAYIWTLELPDGRALESPGNFFHNLLEPTIWGTRADYVGLAADLDGDGTAELGEVLPEANVLLASAQGLDGATQEMIDAVNAWEPTMSDAFTALVIMIPTMNEYFEQWKLSSYIAGDASQEVSFVGASRLFDINGILTGLDYTYDNVSAQVAGADQPLHSQIDDGFADLRAYVSDLYEQELDGTRFTAEQADLFGTEAQAKATTLAGQVSQAAALLNVEIAE